MSRLTKLLKSLCSKDWFLAFLLLGVFMATNRYIYGWDDQHLEIPLLKKLIDPTLYQGDYYVESLAANFTSYLYIILSKILTVDQIPAAYFILFVISRYFFFFWSLKLWDLFSRKYGAGENILYSPKFIALCAGMMSILIGRTEEFLYRTFSHQEFALPIILAAIYYFFKDRFMLAALLFGIAANFHALYALFPMIYMCAYLFLFHPERRIANTFKAGIIFVAAAFPFIFWTVTHHASRLPPSATDNWLDMYYLTFSTIFFFGDAKFPDVLFDLKLLVSKTYLVIVLAALYVFHVIANPPFRRDRKMHAVALGASLLLFACFYFIYIHPLHIAVNMNLIRNDQYLRYLLMGITTIFVFQKIEGKSPWDAFLLSIMFMALWFRGPFGSLVVTAVALIYIARNWREICASWDRTKVGVMTGILAIFFVMLLFGIDYSTVRIDKLFLNVLAAAGVLAAALIETTRKTRNRSVFILLPLALAFLYFCYYHYQFYQISTKGGGFWQMQRNWEDMQRFARENTPKDANIMIPYNMEMGGFRIQSERKVLVCYRDSGIIGFDYPAVLEWHQRIKDIESFKVFTDPRSIGPAIVNGLYKYKVDYIVFMRYYAPDDNDLVRKIYENEVFALYKVVAPIK